MSAIRRRSRRALFWRIVDGAFFYCLVVLGQWLTIHGKAVSSYLLVATHGELVRQTENHREILAIVLLTALAVSLIRMTRWGNRGRILVLALCATISPLAVRMNDEPSSLILFLDMFFLTFAAGVAWANSLLAQRMQIRYWEILFDNAVKATQTLIASYGVLMAVLGVVTRKVTEDANGFLTTAAYPTMVVMLVLFLIGYWVIMPLWQMIGDHYRQGYRAIGKR